MDPRLVVEQWEEEERPNIVFDLDDTLLYCVPDADVDAVVRELEAGPTKLNYYWYTEDAPDENGVFRRSPVVLRPGLQELLSYVLAHFDVYIFTAASKHYAETAVENIFGPRLKEYLPVWSKADCHIEWANDEATAIYKKLGEKTGRNNASLDSYNTLFIDDRAGASVHNVFVNTYTGNHYVMPLFARPGRENEATDVKHLKNDGELHTLKTYIMDWLYRRAGV